MARNELDWFVARRYLASRKKGRFLSLITWIALLGITLGVMALVIVISVMNGAQGQLRDMILGSTPHLLVQQSGRALRLDNWQPVVERIEEVEGVVAATPVIYTQVGLLRSEYAQPSDLLGIAVDTARGASDVERELSGPDYLGAPTASGLPGIVLGIRLAERLDLFAGDTVQVIAMENVKLGPLGGLVPAIRNFEVRGRIETGVYDYDLRNSYSALEHVQEILAMPADQVSAISVRTEDPATADEAGDLVFEALGGFPYFTQSWIQRNEQLFEALKLEKLAMFVILFLIVTVAAFNIVSTLVMVVADRTREIGILKSMGMTDARIQKIFMLQGIWIGAIGTLLGATLGVVISLLLKRYPLISLPASVYTLDHLPVRVRPLDLLWIVGLSIAIAVLATIYPSRQASRLDPVEAIRHE